MESPNPANPNQPTHLERHLAHLKVLSRLIGLELHSQTGVRLTVSRDELTEMQTSLDLFIEEMSRQRGTATLSRVEPTTIPARLN